MGKKKMLMRKFGTLINCGDADGIAFLTATGITDSTIQGAICTLVTDLKTAGLWSKSKAIYPIVGGTMESHRFNLIDPTLYKTGTNAYTHSSTGMLEGNYGMTLMAMNVFTKDNLALGAYCRSNILNSNATFFNNTSYLQYFIRLSNLFLIDLGNFNGSVPQRITFSNSSSLGFFLNSHNPSFQNQIYINGVLKKTQASSEVSYSMGGTISFNGKRQTAGAYREYAFITLTEALTPTENTDLYNIIQAFQTTLGRQV